MVTNYRQLLLALEDALGTGNLLVDHQAREPADILLPTGVHDRLLKSTLRAVYKNNKCYHINAPISAARTLPVLAELRHRVREDSAADITLVHLVDDLYEQALKLFERNSPHEQQPAGKQTPAEATPPLAEVLTLPVTAAQRRAATP